MAKKQMTLELNLRDDAVLENFYPGQKNRQLLRTLQEMARGRGEHFVYLWGNRGVGRTHLLHAVCHTATRLKLTNFYLSLKNLDELSPDVFEDLETLHLVCLDNIDYIANKPEWEEAFFDFLNRMHDASKRLIISGSNAPNHLPIVMPDIKSRLSQAIVFRVHALTDEEKVDALCLRAKLLGFNLKPMIARFLLKHLQRDMGSLFEALDKLDKASLEAQHKITIPFVKEVLSI